MKPRLVIFNYNTIKEAVNSRVYKDVQELREDAVNHSSNDQRLMIRDSAIDRGMEIFGLRHAGDLRTRMCVTDV